MKLLAIYKNILKEDLEYNHVSDATKDEYIMSENNHSQYIELGVKNSFNSVEQSSEHLKKILKLLKSLPNTLKLYRVIFVKNKKDINTVEPGSHYALDKKNLEMSHHNKSGNGIPFILTVTCPKSLIDIDFTIKTRMIYSNEDEIALKNKGRGAKIVDISPFISNDNIDDILGSGFDDDFSNYDDGDYYY